MQFSLPINCSLMTGIQVITRVLDLLLISYVVGHDCDSGGNVWSGEAGFSAYRFPRTIIYIQQA